MRENGGPKTAAKQKPGGPDQEDHATASTAQRASAATRPHKAALLSGRSRDGERSAASIGGNEAAQGGLVERDDDRHEYSAGSSHQ